MANRHIEIELRYKVLNLELLHVFVEGCQLIGQKRDEDVYFDNKTRDLFKKGVFVRTRNNIAAEIKFNRSCIQNPELEKQDYCEEYSFDLPFKQHEQQRFNAVIRSLDLQEASPFNFESFLCNNRFEPHYTVDKIRTTYQKDHFVIAVDEIAQLGTFLEIECMAYDALELEAIKLRMQKTVSSLDLEPLKTGYGTLLLRTNNFKEYLLGRYVLPEDKHLKSKGMK